MTQFDSGAYTIPPQHVIINEKPFSTDSVRVEVRDVPVDTTKQKMFDIKPAIEVKNPPFNWLLLLYWLVPLLVLGGLVYYFFRRKKIKEEREKQLPPYEEAMVALQKLDASEYLKENKSKAYYSSLTEIVKRYIDREVDDKAMESTSDELIERLLLHKDAGNFDFDQEMIRKLDAILKRADLVKFAKFQQDLLQAKSDRATIEEIINETHDAIPEPTEEELLQDELYRQEQLRKKRKRKLIYGSISVVVALFLTLGILAATYGVSYVKDKIIGHPSKELLEGRWYKSEYGSPAVVIETPKVLVRTELELPDEVKQQVENMSVFSYGSLIDQFYILVNSTKFKTEAEIPLEQSLEGSLQEMEKRGAENMVVKQEAFETEKGIKGRKAFGTFQRKNPNGKYAPKQKFEIIVFSQKGALQQVVIAYGEQDQYAQQIVERINNSIELEITHQGEKQEN
ncbi:MAG: DUF4381 domain-containing protein [Flavobacteriaceae bacterium]